MKRLVCLLLVVSIAYAGCAEKKKGKVTVVATKRGWSTEDGYKSNAVLRQEIVRLRDALNKARRMQRPEVLLARFDALEENVLHQIYEVGYATTYQRNAVESAEVAIESQRVTIEVLQKLCRLYEEILGRQRSTIEVLKKICRLYDNEIDLER